MGNVKGRRKFGKQSGVLPTVQKPKSFNMTGPIQNMLTIKENYESKTVNDLSI